MVQAGGGNSGFGRDGERFAMTSSDVNIFTRASHDVIDAAVKSICQDFLDDAILNVAFEIHRSMKRGLLVLENGTVEDENRFKQVEVDGLDVFGHAPGKKQQECICPNCSRNLAASRFAPHLEKCMGMGRNSSRIASRRIQSSTRENNSHIGQGSDDDDDDDWGVDRDRKRRKRDKNSPRRSRSMKVKSETYVSSSSSSNGLLNSNSNGNNLSSNENTMISSSIEDKRPLLCGVISEHTGKRCTRSLRCPQHLEQRKNIREQYLSGLGDGIIGGSTMRLADSTSNVKYSSLIESDDVQIDNDALDAEVSHLTSSWDHDLSNTTSPADSTSTNNSSTATTSSTTSSNSSNNKRSSSSSKSKKKSKSSKKENHNID